MNSLEERDWVADCRAAKAGTVFSGFKDGGLRRRILFPLSAAAFYL
jgi:hypothetical protein